MNIIEFFKTWGGAFVLGILVTSIFDLIVSNLASAMWKFYYQQKQKELENLKYGD